MGEDFCVSFKDGLINYALHVGILDFGLIRRLKKLVKINYDRSPLVACLENKQIIDCSGDF